MNRVRAVLQLARSAFPTPPTLWRSFERVPTRVWRQLLDQSAPRCDPGDHGAVDATLFDHQAASRHYKNRSDRHIQALKTMALVDTGSCAVLDLHCSAHWPHDTKVGRQVALHNTDEIKSLASNKGYEDQSLQGTLRSEGVRLLIKHRLFAHYDHAYNARLDSDLYGQRWTAETSFSAIKHRYGSAVGPSAWYCQFRELVLTAAVYNLEQAVKG